MKIRIGYGLGAQRGLNADGFADKDKTPADLGLDKPSATVVITLNDGKFLAVLEECDYVRPERPMSGIGPKAEVDEHALF